VAGSLRMTWPRCGRPLDASSDRTPLAYTPKHLANKILASKSALEGERKHDVAALPPRLVTQLSRSPWIPSATGDAAVHLFARRRAIYVHPGPAPELLVRRGRQPAAVLVEPVVEQGRSADEPVGQDPGKRPDDARDARSALGLLHAPAVSAEDVQGGRGDVSMALADGADHFCPTCGCGTYSESPDFSSGDPDFEHPKIGANARLLDDFDLEAVPVPHRTPIAEPDRGLRAVSGRAARARWR